jgi:hypothetical protein
LANSKLRDEKGRNLGLVAASKEESETHIERLAPKSIKL